MGSPPLSAHRPGGFLLLQDDRPPLTTHGYGTLASLIRNRSTTSLHHPHASSSPWRASFALSQDEQEALLDRPVPDEESGRFDDQRMAAILNGPHMRSMRLIGNSNPRYSWERYWKPQQDLASMPKHMREYYERTNLLVQQYLYIDRLLDSSLPHDLLNEYNNMPASAFRGVEVPYTIQEESPTPLLPGRHSSSSSLVAVENGPTSAAHKKVKRTPKDIYRPTETTPLFENRDDGQACDDPDDASRADIPWLEDDEVDSSSPIVTLAIYINFAANAILLAGKIAVIISVPSVSVLASLVDAVLDFLSTVIVWVTTWMISRQDRYAYPVGRRRLEPLGVLVFSVIMITSFVQVALEAIQHLASDDHAIIQLGIPAITIMVGTIVIKGICWLWCRLVKNSSVQALAADASTDVIFNAGSIAFPIVGFYARIWWLDALGGLLLSLVVIFNWCQTSGQHIRNLCGFSATADQRNILLYLTMRFAKTIRQIQGLQAYHVGDKLNVEVDIVLDASTSLKDSHDLSESLQYVLESVPIVDRAFVHVDYASYNLPTHMQQQAE